MRAPSILPVLTILGSLFSGAAMAQETPSALRPGLVSSCEACHGVNGQTRSVQVPRLNGQTREYLIARLRDLRNPANQSVNAIHNMLTPARGIRESELTALAEHFAAQPPNSPNGSGRGRDAGALLYARGAGERLPGCAACHGDTGQGIGEAPRLAGQHTSYLVDQMEALMLTARFQPGMNKHAWGLWPQEIRDLAAFLGSD